MLIAFIIYLLYCLFADWRPSHYGEFRRYCGKKGKPRSMIGFIFASIFSPLNASSIFSLSPLNPVCFLVIAGFDLIVFYIALLDDFLVNFGGLFGITEANFAGAENPIKEVKSHARLILWIIYAIIAALTMFILEILIHRKLLTCPECDRRNAIIITSDRLLTEGFKSETNSSGNRVNYRVGTREVEIACKYCDYEDELELKFKDKS